MFAQGFRTIRAALAAGVVSCRDVVDRSLSQLDAHAWTNAVAWRDDDAVRAAAAALDARYAAEGPVGPLHGLPISVKDWIEATPFPCAGGQPAHRDRRPGRDATVVARLRAAGAIVVGKASAGAHTELYGTVRHGVDPGLSPGGSSAGDAVLVAAGAVAFGLGSDSGGSLRYPAHCTGIATIRPTYGRVPLTGHFPRVGPGSDGRTVIGPLARTVADVRAVLDVIAGPDGRDPACPPVPVASGSGVGAHRRVALDRRPLAGAGALDLAGDVAVERAAAALAAAGAEVVECDVLGVDAALDITRRYWGRSSLSGREVDRFLADWDRERVRAMGLLARFDAILTPAAPEPARPLGQADDTDWTFTLAPSLWGWPAAVVRAGWAGSDPPLPVGVQLIAGPWREDLCLALAAVVEAGCR